MGVMSFLGHKLLAFGEEKAHQAAHAIGGAVSSSAHEVGLDGTLAQHPKGILGSLGWAGEVAGRTAALVQDVEYKGVKATAMGGIHALGWFGHEIGEGIHAVGGAIKGGVHDAGEAITSSVHDVGLDKALTERPKSFWGAVTLPASILARTIGLGAELEYKAAKTAVMGGVHAYKAATGYLDELNTKVAEEEFDDEAKNTPEFVKTIVSKYPDTFKSFARLAHIGHDIAQIGGGIAGIAGLLADGVTATAAAGSVASGGVATPALVAAIGNSGYWTAAQVALSALGLGFGEKEAEFDTWIAVSTGKDEDKKTAIDQWKDVNKDSVTFVFSAVSAALKSVGLMKALSSDADVRIKAIKTLAGVDEVTKVTGTGFIANVKKAWQFGVEIYDKVSRFAEPFLKVKEYAEAGWEIAEGAADIGGVKLKEVVKDQAARGWNWLSVKVHAAESRASRFAQKVVSRTKSMVEGAESGLEITSQVIRNGASSIGTSTFDYLVAHNVQITNFLQGTSTVFGVLSGVAGAVGLGSAVTGIGAVTVAPVAGVLSLLFGGLSLGTELLATQVMQLGLRNGSVTEDEFNKSLVNLAKDTLLQLASIAVPEIGKSANESADAAAKEASLSASAVHEQPSVGEVENSTGLLQSLSEKIGSFVAFVTPGLKDYYELEGLSPLVALLKGTMSFGLDLKSFIDTGLKVWEGMTWVTDQARAAENKAIAIGNKVDHSIVSFGERLMHWGSKKVDAAETGISNKLHKEETAYGGFLKRGASFMSSLFHPAQLAPAFAGGGGMSGGGGASGSWAMDRMMVFKDDQPAFAPSPPPLPPKQHVQKKGSRSDSEIDAASIQHHLRQNEVAGASIDSETSQKLAEHVGADFSQVRVHTGATAAHVASGLGAEAFTIGRDIYFAANRFSPHDPQGMGLLAHELTHVQQQHSSQDRARFYTKIGGDAMEREAQAIEMAVLSGGSSFFEVGDIEEIVELEDNDAGPAEDITRIQRIRERMLKLVETGLRAQAKSPTTIAHVSVDISLDLGTQSDDEAAVVWASAVIAAIGTPKPHELTIPTLVGIQRAPSGIGDSDANDSCEEKPAFSSEQTQSSLTDSPQAQSGHDQETDSSSPALNQAKQAGNVLIGYGEGLVDSVVTLGKTTVGAVAHPIDTTKAVGHAVAHPIDTAHKMYEAVKQVGLDFLDAVDRGDNEAAGRILGNAVGTIVTPAAIAKGVTGAARAVQAVRASEAADAAAVVERTTAVERVETEVASTESVENAAVVRSSPETLEEKFTMEEAQKGEGDAIMMGKIKDPRYAGTHTKFEHSHKLPNGDTIIVHYWKNNATGELSGFKFKTPPLGTPGSLNGPK